MRTIKEKSPAGFDKIQYVEQPTERDLKADRTERHARGSEAQARRDRRVADRPGDADAGARDGLHRRGAEGVQRTGPALLMAAAAQKHKMFLCVQDLTCPGASLIHSAGMAAHVPGVAAIEANARQYVPLRTRLGEEVSRHLHHQRRADEDGRLVDRPRRD